MNNSQNNKIVLKCYRACSYNENLLNKSSSGAVFGEIALKVISEGGIVFGASFDTDWTVSIHEVSTVEDLHTIFGSKYVQAKTNGVYHRVNQLLSEGKKVLFCSTPCQCNALISFLSNKKSFNRSNLLIIDFICHGVPGEGIYKKYINHISGGKSITDFSFRDKRISWNHYGTRILFDDGTEYFKEHQDDAYMKLFLANRILRPSCHRCKAKAEHRVSDITLGDFWGLQGEKSEKGCSVSVINTEYGMRLFDSVKNKFDCMEIPIETALRNNSNYYQSCGIPFNRSVVLQMVSENSGEVFDTADKYIKTSFFEKVIRRSIRIIRNRRKVKMRCYLEFDKVSVDRFEAKAECSGCGACMASCPVKAISMKKDNEGFYYPFISNDDCIHCNKCIRICKGTV